MEVTLTLKITASDNYSSPKSLGEEIAEYLRNASDIDSVEIVKDEPTEKIKPINLKDVVAKKKAQLPPEVLDAFNELIAEHFDGTSSSFEQKEVVSRIRKKFGGKYTSQQLFDRNWLDVEPIYRKEGWKVEYDKPAYCESYEATFEFTKKR